ncbi:hypothetical protein O0I10_011757 [Lichtheimia ornata]|uniref:Uncharacterized protein n=1 Tax=Lichtheimia ornata TaxID=688661 RepID=A0AAD7XTT9_9FUNG|nr:uncharacterized protein O0I10_011757 [Lichtheimia ornata]KAJ8652611.1 hypothetical protein O0I10_011757 [Lichtheimia ornata]
MHFSSSLALVAAAFVLGVVAVAESPSQGGVGNPDAAAASGSTKTQTVEEYFKLHDNPQLQTYCENRCSDMPYTADKPDDKDGCLKYCITTNAPFLGLPAPNFN